jgi:hypothetical protein
MRALECAKLLSVSLLGGVGDSNGLDEVLPDAATTATASIQRRPSAVSLGLEGLAQRLAR